MIYFFPIIPIDHLVVVIEINLGTVTSPPVRSEIQEAVLCCPLRGHDITLRSQYCQWGIREGSLPRQAEMSASCYKVPYSIISGKITG